MSAFLVVSISVIACRGVPRRGLRSLREMPYRQYVDADRPRLGAYSFHGTSLLGV